MRTVCSFFVLGAALLLAKLQWEKQLDRAQPTLLVHVASDADPATIANAIERAALCEHAIALGAAHLDLVVQKELLGAVAPAFKGETAGARIDRALLLGVHRAAPVVCERLAFQMRQTLRADVTEPSPDVLQRYLREHASRYQQPARIEGTQIYVSSERHGARTKEVAIQRFERARTLDDSARALELADPSLLPSQLHSMTRAELDRSFGPGFGSSVFALELHALSKPIASRFGLHLVRIEARSPERVPAWPTIRSRVRDDYLLDGRALAERHAVKRLCKGYRVELRKVSP